MSSTWTNASKRLSGRHFYRYAVNAQEIHGPRKQCLKFSMCYIPARRAKRWGLPAPAEVNEFQHLLLQLFISGHNEQIKSGRGWLHLLFEDHLMPLENEKERINFGLLMWSFFSSYFDLILYNFLAPLFISQFGILSCHLHVLSHHLDFSLIILNNLSCLHFLFSFSKLSPLTFVVS